MNKTKYKPLIVPKLEWEKKSLTDTYGKFIAVPLEPGFGITLGNSLRRILLGAVEGSAVTSVLISGVNNEFATIQGVVEDVMRLILNIKQIVIKNTENLPGEMSLSASGEGVVKVSDIKADAHLELINKDFVLATLAYDGKLDIKFFVESGRGYQAAQWPVDKGARKDDKIYIDAMFSPVRNVEFNIEKTRVGDKIDFDKLEFAITTSGAETPLDVLHYASSILINQFKNFLTIDEIPFDTFAIKEVVEIDEYSDLLKRLKLDKIPLEFFFKSIDELELSARASNCLEQANLKRVIDLVNFTEDEGLNIKNFGKKSLEEVKEVLSSLGLRLGMNLDESLLLKILESRKTLEQQTEEN